MPRKTAKKVEPVEQQQKPETVSDRFISLDHQRMFYDQMKNGDLDKNYWINKASVYDRNYGYNGYANGGSANNSINRDLTTQWRIAEEAHANHPIYRGVIAQLTNATILDGFNFSFDCEAENKKELDDWTEKQFAIWSKKTDASGTGDLNSQIFTTIHNFFLYGESFSVLVEPTKSNSKYHTRIRIIPMDKLATSAAAKGKGNTVEIGVELNGWGEPIRLAIHGDKSVRYMDIYDEDGCNLVLHTFEKLFPGQTHGSCPITPIYNLLLDLSTYQTSEVKAAANASQINVVSEMPDPYAQAMHLDKLAPNGISNPTPVKTPIIPVTSGGWIVQTPGSKIHQFKHERPSTLYPDFIKANMKIICSAMGYSYEYVFNDWSDSNFSSARVAAIQTQATLKRIHKLITTTFIQPAVERFLAEAWESEGRPETNISFEDYLESYKIIPPKLPLLDQTKEIDNSIKLINSGLSTRQRESLKLGFGDYFDILTQVKREEDEIRELGLSVSTQLPGSPGKPPGENSTRS